MSGCSKLQYLFSRYKSISNTAILYASKNNRKVPPGVKCVHTSSCLFNESMGQNININSETGKSTLSNSTPSTFSAFEVDKFRHLSEDWWKVNGAFQPLHSMNHLRVPLIRDGILSTCTSVDDTAKDGPHPLKGIKILDVGCGGGILSEPLARLGAQVTGLDAAEEGIEAAKLHAEKDDRLSANLTYICSSIEDHVASLEHPYDAVVASEVLEHVASVDTFLESCCTAIKPGGSLFITTLNRTPQSYVGAIVLAEYLLGLLPRGTHDWNKFVPLGELMEQLDRREFHSRLVHGMFYTPVANKWCWVKDTGVNYALHAVKGGREHPKQE